MNIERLDRIANLCEEIAREIRSITGTEFQSPTIREQAKAESRNGIQCNCGIAAEYQTGTSEKTGKDWARYVCSKPPRDPKNCGFKRWVD
jgi:hypothetical protein